MMKFIKKFFIVAVSLIAFVFLLNLLSPITIIPRTIVPKKSVDEELKKELRRMNNMQDSNELDWFDLDYARNGLIVLHNSKYAIVLCEKEGTWTITQMLNPNPLRHFWLQGSTVSSVDVDESEQYIAIHSIGIDNVNDPLYIFNLQDSQFTKYAHGDFPEDLNFSRTPTNLIFTLWTDVEPPQEIREYMYNRGANAVVFYGVDDKPVKEVKLKTEPDSSLYLYDDSTIVYLSNSFILSKISFHDIKSGNVQEIVIR